MFRVQYLSNQRSKTKFKYDLKFSYKFLFGLFYNFFRLSWYFDGKMAMCTADFGWSINSCVRCSCRTSWRPSSSSPSRRRNTSSSVWHYVGTRYFLKILSKCVISSFKFILSDRPALNNGASCMYQYIIFLNFSCVICLKSQKLTQKSPKKS